MSYGSLSVPGNNNALPDGTYTLTITSLERAGNFSASVYTTLVVDTSTGAPSVGLAAQDDTAGSYFSADATSDNLTSTDRTRTGMVNPANAFTLQGNVAETRSTVTLYVAHSLGDGTFSDYAEVSGAVVQPMIDGTAWSCIVPNADLAAGDGIYRFKAVAMDRAGNTNEDTVDIAVDSQAPSLLNNNELWLNNDSGAEDLKTNSDFLELRGRLADISDTDIVLYVRQGNDEPIRVTDIDWDTGEWRLEYAGAGGASLPEGNYSFVLYAEDRAGNLTTYPADGTFNVVIDRQPSITLGPVTADNTLNITEVAGDVTITGTTINVNPGDVLTLTVNGQTYMGAVAADGSFSINVSGSDLAADADTTIEASVTISDTEGNFVTGTDSHGYGVDIIPLATPTITFGPVTADNVLNTAEAAGNVAITGMLSGVNVGDEVTLTVNGKTYIGAATVNGSFSINVAGIDLAADPDRIIEASLTTHDAVGNSATGTASHGYGVDITPPATPTITIDPVTADNVLNMTEAAGDVTVTGMTTNTTEGDWVTLTVNGVEHTGQVDSDGNFSIHVPGSDLAADADTTIEASVTTFDPAGNFATDGCDHAYATSSMVHADFDLSGALQDDNPGDTLALDDVESIRATISGDLDGDGTTDSLTMDAEVSETGAWSLHFSQELAVGDYNLNLSALAADGSPVALASTTDLTYDFSVLAKDMLADPADSQILFNEAAENTEPAGSETPAPGAVDTVTIVDPHVTIEEHVL